MSAIYHIVNTETGAVYVGSTVAAKRRRMEHWKKLRAGSHPCRHLQSAYQKYGPSVFEFVCAPANDLLSEEQAAIDEAVARLGRRRVYNASLLADRTDWSQESRDLLASKRVGKDNPFYGKQHTAEARAAMSASRAGRTPWNKGLKATPEHRAAISAGITGKVQSEETKIKRSRAMKALVESGELFGESHRAAMSAAQRRRRSGAANTMDT